MGTFELPKPGETFIEAHGLTQRTPLRSTYRYVDLSVPRGSLCSIVAQDRCGKTELLLTLAGHMRQTSGSLIVAGLEMPRRAAAIRRLSGMGFIAGVNEVQPFLTLREVASAELNLHSLASNKQATLSFLDEWGFADRARVRTEQLDRFDRVMFGIALGLVGDPALLVVDDIEEDLTLGQGAQIMSTLGSVASKRGTTVVVACTDYELGRHAEVVAPISDAAREQVEAARRCSSHA